jgi:Flp pilus assembly secretin CpaC
LDITKHSKHNHQFAVGALVRVEIAVVRRLNAALFVITALTGQVPAHQAVAENPAAAPTAVTSTSASGAGVAVQEDVPRRSVELTTDSAIALQSVEPYAELSIANPDIADISTISNTGIYLLGKKPGRTTLMMIAGDGRIISVIDVRVAPDISEFKARLSELLPDEKINAFTAKDGIVLTGEVSGHTEMKRAVELANHYAAGRISNLMTVTTQEAATPDIEAFVARLNALLPNERIDVNLAEGGLVLSGIATSIEARDSALALAERFAPNQVVSLISVEMSRPTPPDVELVARRLAEVLPQESISVHLLGETMVLSGRASSAVNAQRAVELVGLLADGIEVSNMITVETARECTVRTRRAGEMVVTNIPCGGATNPPVETSRNATTIDLPASPTASITVAARDRNEGPSMRPMPRPDDRL